MPALLSITSEARRLRYACLHLRHLFPYLPQQPGHDKRLRKLAATVNQLIHRIAADTSRWADDVWVIDSTPIECVRSRETVHRCDLAGRARYGYCASHSRYFRGLRLHLVATLHGLQIAFAPTGAKADERQTLPDIPADDPDLVAARPGQILIADKHYYGHDFETALTDAGLRLLRPARKGEPERDDQRFFRTPPPDHRIDLRHRQGPARPRTPRRTHP